jgi:hypothetical protein
VQAKKSAKSGGPGKGKVYISTTIPKDVDARLREYCKMGGITRGALARAYIVDGVLAGRYLTNTWKSDAGR